ncbi:prealbumin-like fold domain-containing protein [bacterium]|nr:prealbumin-like fold domain-containing protein [bacterium]
MKFIPKQSKLVLSLTSCGAILLLLSGIIGCDKSESSSGLKGIVAVDGTDGDSVVVRLYEYPDTEADVSVWSIPSQYSTVAFPYQSEFAYDYRMQWQIAVDTTDAQGRFEFKDLNPGDYIVVADGNLSNFGSSHYKENYGWSWPRNVRVDGSEADAGTLQLYPDTVLGVTNISSPVTFTAGRHWVLNGNLYIGSGGSLTVEPGTVIRVSAGKSIYVSAGGELTCIGSPDQFIVFTTDDLIARDPEEWGTILFSEGAAPPQFKYCRLEFAWTAIESNVDGGSVEFCYFRSLNEALRSSGIPPVFSRNVILRAGLGVHCGASTNVDITHNVFQTCDPFSITMDIVDGGEIFCNWFRDGGGSDSSGSGERGVIRLDWVKNVEIYQNSFETSWYALTVRSGVDSTAIIHHNKFHRMHAVLFIGITNDRLRYAQPIFQYNCMTTVDGLYAHILACHVNSRDIHAENNYWNGVQSPTSLHNSYLWDCVRQPAEPPCPCFLLEPILSGCGQVETLTGIPAGICGE